MSPPSVNGVCTIGRTPCKRRIPVSPKLHYVPRGDTRAKPQATFTPLTKSPIANASVLVEHALQHLLLKRMLLHLRLVDRDAQTRLRVGPNDAAGLFHGEAFLHDVLPPRHIRMDGLANDIARLRKAELQRRGRADGAL